MKKRVLIGLLVLVLFGAMALGSGGSSGSKKKIEKNESTEKTESTETTENDDEDKSSEAKSDKDSSGKEEKNDTTIEEQVLVDDHDIKITATKYETHDILSDDISLLIENNGTEDVAVTCDALIVNGYMMNDFFSSTVAAGKKANETIDISSGQLKSAGIDNVGQIEVYFRFYDPDSYDDIFKTDCITIKTSNYDQMDITANDDGQELYNSNGVRIVGKFLNEDTIWGTAVVLYIENNNDFNVCVQCEDMSINGFMVNPVFSSTIYADRKIIDDITIFSSDLEDNGIDSVEDIELKFKAYNVDTYDDVFETEPITFKVN